MTLPTKLVPAVAAAALPVAVLAALAGRGPANTWADLAYPFAILPLALLLAAWARRRRPDQLRTAMAVGAVGWALNALVVALRSLTAWPAVAWIADWCYLVPDFAVLAGLVLLTPDGRLTGALRPIAVAVGAGVALQVLAGVAAPGTLDNTTVANPLGLAILSPLRHARDWGFLATGAGGLLTALAVHARRRDRRGVAVAVLLAVAFAFAGASATSFGAALLASVPFTLALAAAIHLAGQPGRDLPAAAGLRARLQLAAE